MGLPRDHSAEREQPDAGEGAPRDRSACKPEVREAPGKFKDTSPYGDRSQDNGPPWREVADGKGLTGGPLGCWSWFPSYVGLVTP